MLSLEERLKLAQQRLATARRYLEQCKTDVKVKEWNQRCKLYRVDVRYYQYLIQERKNHATMGKRHT